MLCVRIEYRKRFGGKIHLSLFKKIFGGGKSPDSYAFKLKRANELHGQAVKYITEQRNGNDDVVGRGGALCVKGDEFIIVWTFEDLKSANHFIHHSLSMMLLNFVKFYTSIL